MKKRLLVLSALVLAGGTVLASCDTPSSETSTVEEVKFSVSLEAEEGSAIKLNKEGKVEPGERVEFEVSLTSDFKELVGVLLDDEELQLDKDGKGHFTMPNHDVTLKTVLFTVGDGSLMNVTSLPSDFVGPTTMDEVKAVFAEAEMVEGKYSNLVSFENNYTSLSGMPYAKLTSIPTRNGEVMTTGNIRTGAGVESSTPYFYQSGYARDKSKVYSIKASGSDYLNTAKFALEPKIYDVVEEVTNKETQKTSEEAERFTSSEGLLNLVSNSFVGSSSLFTSSTKITVDKDSDNKGYTLSLDCLYSSTYSGMSINSLEAKVDGDGFISFVDFETITYKNADWDSDAGAPVEGAVADSDYTMSYVAVRGYKYDFEVAYDIEDFVMKDYDISFLQKLAGTYSATAISGNEVQGNATISYRVVCDDVLSMNSIKPKIVAVTEGFGVIASNGYSFEVTKLGDFEVTFDNGLGDLVTKKLTAVAPTATKIEFSRASNSSIFAGEESEITVTAFPSLSKQDVTLEVDTSKSGVDALITAKGNGVFTIKPAEVGSVYLKATANNGTLSTTLTLKAVEKPSVDSIKTVLTTKSIKLYYNREYYYINCNEDGTGTMYIGSSYDGFNAYPFTSYVVNEDLTVSFTFPSHEGKKVWYEIASMEYVNESTINVKIVGEYNGKSSELTKTFAADTRKQDSYFED